MGVNVRPRQVLDYRERCKLQNKMQVVKKVLEKVNLYVDVM